MSSKAPNRRSGRISDRTYVMPFGRFVGSSEVGPPADEVLVGREGQRAYLIDLLISTGRRGAYLVTGRRGAGKTSFVKHCIAEYEASVFSRFLRANVGRGFWDRAIVLGFWMAIIFGALILSELTQLLMPPQELGERQSLLRWVLIAPILVGLMYPAVYARAVLEAIAQQWTARKVVPEKQQDKVRERGQREKLTVATAIARSESQVPGVVATACTVVLTVLAWFLPPLGSPVLGVAAFIPLLGSVYLVAQSLSFERVWHPTWKQPVIYAVLVLVALAGCCGIVLAWRSEPDQAGLFHFSVALGAWFLGLGMIARSIQQAMRVRRTSLHRAPAGFSVHNLLRVAVEAGSQWYFWPGIGLIPGGALLLLGVPRSLGTALVGWLVAVLVLIGLGMVVLLSSRPRPKAKEGTPAPFQFRPRPAWLFLAKALLSLVIALQLARPALGRLQPEFLAGVCTWAHDVSAPLARGGGLGEPAPAALCSSQSGPGVFVARADEQYWLVALMVLVALFSYLEYEWIVRPYVRPREDRAVDAGDQAPWDDWDDYRQERPAPVEGHEQGKVAEGALSEYDHERLHRRFAELTLPWVVYKTWLPALPVAVNLGFDRLGHRQVIQAMLVGLRERYYRTFLAWNCWFANFGRFVGFLVLLALVRLAGTAWFDSPTSGVAGLAVGANRIWYEALFLDLVPLSVKCRAEELVDGQSLLLDLLPYRASESLEVLCRESTQSIGRPWMPAGLHFSASHLLLLVLFFFAGKWLLRRIPLLPYKENLRRIEDLLDSLSARTRVTFASSLWGPARWVHSVFSDERLRETERDPVDPRTVELAFLQILEDIQKGGFRFPGAARHHLTMPAPEITFMFDELDKLGTRVDPEASIIEPVAQQQEARALFDERERSIKLRALLSDLKNILASAPARFIFVGGRDLHDEWLADQTARQPLLTSIFSTEVYLPSLMVDHSGRTQWPTSGMQTSAQRWTLDRRIDEYIRHQYRRAAILHFRAARKRHRPSFGLSVESLVHERYFSSGEPPELPPVVCVDDSAVEDDALAAEGEALKRDFVRFLTHRSMGNAKRLKDLLASFITPAGRELMPSLRWEKAPCRHVLHFEDVDIFRIQLLVTIYRHLILEFEGQMVRRDDKLAVSIFFLTDFLFKFHRRAFSWSNLERVDDLAHIHRLPDLRDVQEELVDHFSERFLHRVLNGMYAFRFRSDVAREVEYLSRRSSVEMAAFNFTLDESQSLKASYLSAMEKEKENPDLVAGLGELYEFDQEFERARHCYRQAIELLDKNLLIKINRPFIEKPTPEDFAATVRAILAGDEAGLENARIFLPWGEARLRLMLQIGMTFEQARNLERATVEYRAARTLARALVRACVTGPDRVSGSEETRRILFAGLLDDARGQDREHGRGGRLHTLKHLPIVFQPVFAEAWASEKSVGTIDTSVSLLEHSLWEIRQSLPFVSTARLRPAEDPTKPPHANFGLTLSQLHNKLGDLYFFKGRQSVELHHVLRGLTQQRTEGKDRFTDGYLLRAHYHYAVALHELRRYVWHRAESSQYRLSIGAGDRRSVTLRRDLLPDFLLRAAASSINDMAEATLARVSLFELLEELQRGVSEKVGTLMALPLEEYCAKWLSGDGVPPKELANWFGEWKRTDLKNSDELLIVFEGPDSAAERLLMSVKLCFVGAGYFEEGGYPEDAARELLQVCDTVTSCLWWMRIVQGIGIRRELLGLNADLRQLLGALPAEGRLDSEKSKGYWSSLIELAVEALEKAFRLFDQSRHREPSESYLLGDVVPAEALTLLCSLALASGRELPAGCEARLRRLTRRWLGEQHGDAEYREMLETSLRRHRYPMINRLNGLKVLIDDAVLNKREPTSEIVAWADELRDSADQFEAPFHFTPLRSGITYALLYLRLALQRVPAIRDLWGNQERFRNAAQRDLQVSEEMYTMRRSYYEAISDLYYLYDDFNDRQIHLNHALQMAGTELACILGCLIDAVPGGGEPPKRPVKPLTQPPAEAADQGPPPAPAPTA